MSRIQVGLIGAGGVARGLHIPGFALCEDAEVTIVCDADQAAASATGIARTCARYQDLLQENVDAVVIASPNHTHAPIVHAAAAAGKHILCEKPLALHLDEARSMLAAAEKAGVVHMTAFTYQFTPAVRYLRRLVQSGRIGRVRSVRAAYLMALSPHLLGWRSLKQYAGSGVLADIGSHLIHLTRYVVGEFASVTASQQRFRDDSESDVEDWISLLARFQNGACGTLEISRICPGRGAGISEDMFIEVYGSEGSAAFSLQDPWRLRVALDEDGRDPTRLLSTIDVPPEFLKLAGSPRDIHAHDARWGYRFDQAYQFIQSIRAGQGRTPTLEDGVRCQSVMEAALASCVSGMWTEVRA
ncbi:MAG: Gfo/Idh/MocA family oxidoreductase [Acidobacteriia bacterium]|nr:Gfo/Idh/MocA family oxidoreductase [Terriglobia bacterium]